MAEVEVSGTVDGPHGCESRHHLGTMESDCLHAVEYSVGLRRFYSKISSQLRQGLFYSMRGVEASMLLCLCM